MKFTGERYVPSEQGELRVEHYHRYAVAMQVAKDKIVLDLACGEGYGSALLSLVANQVIGVDISDEAIAHARTAYAARENLRFECNSATDTSFPNEYFDLVISYETIEHLAEQEEMLAEIRRVLKPEGMLLISSPNRPVYSEGRDFKNEFHVKELDFAEFDALLRPHFGQIDYYGQRLTMGTVIQPLTGSRQSYQALSDNGEEIVSQTFDLKSPTYFVALCGAADSPLPALNASILIPSSLDLVEHYVGFAHWARNQDHELKIRDSNVLHYKNEAEQLGKRIQEMQRQIQEKVESITQLEKMRTNLRNEIIRAEAQLDLLKDLLIAEDDKDTL